MTHFQPTLTSAFRPAALLRTRTPREDVRLPIPVAFAIISASSLALWLLIWKLAALAIG